MTNRLTLKKWIFSAVFSLVSVCASAEVVVIVNAKSPVSSSNALEIQQLYLGKTSDLSGTKMKPIDQIEGNEPRKIFYQKVIEKDAAQLNAYWSRLIFSGKGSPPKTYFDDSEVIEMVMEEKDVVGYIDAASVTEGIKVIHTVK